MQGCSVMAGLRFEEQGRSDRGAIAVHSYHAGHCNRPARARAAGVAAAALVCKQNAKHAQHAAVHCVRMFYFISGSGGLRGVGTKFVICWR